MPGAGEDFTRLATAYDMYDRLAATLDQPDINEITVRAVVLQLAGSPDFTAPLGSARGEIHLAIVSDPAANLPRFLSAVEDLALQKTARMNGTNATLAGAIGDVSGGELTPGPILDETVELTIVEQGDSTSSETQDALQQILDTGEYSFAKASYRETVSAPGSVLFALNPEYGHFDSYEPIGRQLPLTPALFSGVDLVLVNRANATDTVQTSEDQLSFEIAREYLTEARGVEPTLTDETRDEITDFIDRIIATVNDSDPTFVPGRERLKETLYRFSLAHARLRLGESTTRADAQRIIPLVESALREIGIDPEVEDVESDIVETGTGTGPTGELLEIVEALESEYKEGAPVGEVIARAVEAGIGEAEAEDTLENLRRKAEVYEPREDYLRTT